MGAINPVVEAKYYSRENGAYRCGLCPHNCLIPINGFGKCGSRKGEQSMLVAYNYGRVSSLCVDPIEKKPLYHFKPHSRIFSVGSIGCNMCCKHCQNYAISLSPTGKKRTTYESPEELTTLCRKEGMNSIAFTYNEPTIWIEYIFDVMEADPTLGCVIITNGLIEEEPLRDLCKISDAFNIDIKGFTDDFYMEICGAHLKDVLNAAKIVHDEGVHLELTYLIIPGHNDSEDELRNFIGWVIENLSPDTPVHFTRFHPDNEMQDVPWTSVETLSKAWDIADEMGLNYAYVGNILKEGMDDTYCPECGTVVMRRLGYLVDFVALEENRCAYCKHDLNLTL